MSRPAGTQHHRFTVEAYFRMAETGILAEDERVEVPSQSWLAEELLGSSE